MGPGMSERSVWGYTWRCVARGMLVIAGLIWAAVLAAISPGISAAAADFFPLNFVVMAVAAIFLYALPFWVGFYLWIVLDPEPPRRRNGERP